MEDGIADRNSKGPSYTLGHVRDRLKRGHGGSPERAGVRWRRRANTPSENALRSRFAASPQAPCMDPTAFVSFLGAGLVAGLIIPLWIAYARRLR